MNTFILKDIPPIYWRMAVVESNTLIKSTIDLNAVVVTSVEWSHQNEIMNTLSKSLFGHAGGMAQGIALLVTTFQQLSIQFCVLRMNPQDFDPLNLALM